MTFISIQGGITGEKPALLTAYVLAALLEAGSDPTSEYVTNAIFCLQTTDADPYLMSLTAYALSLARHETTETVIQELIAIAVNSSSEMHWTLPAKNGVYL